MCCFIFIFGLALFVYYTEAENAGKVVLFSEKNFQGITKAYPFVAASCVSGFPSGLNESVRSLRTDHPIAVYPEANCKGSVKVAFRAGSHPDLLSYIKNQAPEFQTVMKSFFMFKYKQNNIQLFSRPGPKGQKPQLLLTLLVADIYSETPCLMFNDTIGTKLGVVDNRLNCLVFYTGKGCTGRSFKVGPQENQVNLQEYEKSETYYGTSLCDKDNEGEKDVRKMEAALLTLEMTQNDPYHNPTPHQDLNEQLK